MATAMIGQSRIAHRRKQAESGFSLIEVVISMAVLTVGLVSLLGVFGLAMASTQTSQEDMIAKQLSNEAYESIVTARNTSQLGWDDLQNVGSTNCPNTGASSCGIFVSGASQIYQAGPDGIYGTSDDSGVRQTLKDPGPDGIFGTSDDITLPLNGYTRTIQITPVYDSLGNLVSSLRSVTITMQYYTPQMKLQKSYTLNSYISQFQ